MSFKMRTVIFTSVSEFRWTDPWDIFLGRDDLRSPNRWKPLCLYVSVWRLELGIILEESKTNTGDYERGQTLINPIPVPILSFHLLVFGQLTD